MFPELGAMSRGRQAARAGFGFADGQFVAGVFGQLRSGAEVTLVQSGLDRVKRVRPAVLFGARLPTEWASRRRLLDRARFQSWRRRHEVRLFEGYLSDQQTADFFEAADAVIIPRSGRHLNSGLMPLAMTFGTPLAAPDRGIYREFLAGSGNALYEQGSPGALASAIERLAGQNQDQLRDANRQRAATWGWPHIVDQVMTAVAASKSGRTIAQ